MSIDCYIRKDKVKVKVKWVVISYFDDQLQYLLFKNPIGGENEKQKWFLYCSTLRIKESIESNLSISIWELTGIEKYTSMNLNSGFKNGIIYLHFVIFADIDKVDAALVLRKNGFWIQSHKILSVLSEENKKFIPSIKKGLKEMINYKPILPSLLPENFTLKQLQKLVESIFAMKLDNANFRRRMKKKEVIVELNEKVRNAKRKPPKLFRFNMAVYKKILEDDNILQLLKK